MRLQHKELHKAKLCKLKYFSPLIETQYEHTNNLNQPDD